MLVVKTVVVEKWRVCSGGYGVIRVVDIVSTHQVRVRAGLLCLRKNEKEWRIEWLVISVLG